MGQIFDRSNRARLTQKNAEELILQSASSYGRNALPIPA